MPHTAVARPLFGTNPIAFAVPTASGPPIVADFSTSVTAEGRVRLAHQNGHAFPAGWIVDAAGNPSDDPAALYEGGAILPAGGHKGSALGLLAEILGGLVAGAGCAALGTSRATGSRSLALHPAPEGVDALVEAVRAAPPAPGFDRVRAPGDPEAETEQVRLREGIPIPDATWAGFVGGRGALRRGRDVTAVDLDRRAADVRSGGREQERGDPAELGRVAVAPERDRRARAGADLLDRARPRRRRGARRPSGSGRYRSSRARSS